MLCLQTNYPEKNNCMYKGYCWVKGMCSQALQNTLISCRFCDMKAVPLTHSPPTERKQQLHTTKIFIIIFCKTTEFWKDYRHPVQMQSQGRGLYGHIPQQILGRLFDERGRKNLVLLKNVTGFFNV